MGSMIKRQTNTKANIATCSTLMKLQGYASDIRAYEEMLAKSDGSEVCLTWMALSACLRASRRMATPAAMQENLSRVIIPRDVLECFKGGKRELLFLQHSRHLRSSAGVIRD
jgi:hypothetical protein